MFFVELYLFYNISKFWRKSIKHNLVMGNNRSKLSIVYKVYVKILYSKIHISLNIIDIKVIYTHKIDKTNMYNILKFQDHC